MIKLLSAIACTILMLTACDHIDSNDRLIYVKPATVGRCVLIEDFTGQKCRNCPRAATVIEQLQKQYGTDTVIAVAIHSGPLALKPTATLNGLRTPLGDLYYKHWKIGHLPLGLINRKGRSAKDAQWPSLVYNEVQQKTTVDIKLAISYDAATRRSHIKATVNSLGNSVAGKLQLWLVEDAITAIQQMPDGKNNKYYVHNHVLRTSINGEWGEAITLANGTSTSKEADCQLEEGWKANHMAVVAFVYNDDSVLQVTRQQLVNP